MNISTDFSILISGYTYSSIPLSSSNSGKGGFAKPGILVEFNARAKIKPQHSCPIRGFYFCDKAEGGQKNGFAKPPFPVKNPLFSVHTYRKNEKRKLLDQL